MTHTRYSPGNVALLAVGAVITSISTFFSVMAAGFGGDPADNFRGFAFLALLNISLMLVPVYLVMLRWCGIGVIAMWCLLVACCMAAILAGVFEGLIVYLILLFIQALVFGAINSKSRSIAAPTGRDA